MTEQEFEKELALSRAQHIKQLNEEAEAKNRVIESLGRYAEFMNGQASHPPAPRYEYRRQRGDHENDWQPVAPGPDWDLWTFFESDNTLSFYWRRPLPEESAMPGGAE